MQMLVNLVEISITTKLAKGNFDMQAKTPLLAHPISRMDSGVQRRSSITA